MAFGNFSDLWSREGHQCPGGWLPSLQWLLLLSCCPEILCAEKGISQSRETEKRVSLSFFSKKSRDNTDCDNFVG